MPEPGRRHNAIVEGPTPERPNPLTVLANTARWTGALLRAAVYGLAAVTAALALLSLAAPQLLQEGIDMWVVRRSLMLWTVVSGTAVAMLVWSREFGKRLVDLVVSGLGLVWVAPIILAISVWIRVTSPGPVFYRSPRVGRRGRLIRALRFRTMYVDAEERLEYELEHNAELRKEFATFHSLTRDPRITPVGRFLHRTSLDELPLLWSVLRGDLSLIGPRARLERDWRDFPEWTDPILEMRPGLVGAWALSWRVLVHPTDWYALDADYVRNWSIRRDARILLGVILVSARLLRFETVVRLDNSLDEDSLRVIRRPRGSDLIPVDTSTLG